MGTARVEKVLIATHKDERDALLRRLQEEGLLHISDFEENTREKPKTDMRSQEDSYLKETLANLNQAITFLSSYAGKRKGGMLAGKPSLPALEFRQRVKELNLPHKLEETKTLSEKASMFDTEERRVHNELETLSPWRGLNHAPADYKELTHTDARFIFISNKEEGASARRLLGELTATLEVVSTEGETEYAVVLFPIDETNVVEDALKTAGVKTIALENFKLPVKDEISLREKRLQKLGAEREGLISKAKEIASELSGLETALDLYENEQHLKEQYPRFMESEEAAFIEGWVRSRDRKALDRIVESFAASEAVSVKPGKDERAPVALENPGVIKPFEMILNMYGTPNGKELDPTPITAPFFAVFFALCLTDAAYGIIIAAAAAWLIWGKKMRNNLIWILFYGGILTIFAGAMTGSWFGNMPDMLQIPWLIQFRDAVTWFDPLKNPMPFFYLSLALGYIQMMFGMGVEVVDGLRTREYGSALFETLPWFAIFLAVPMLIATGMGVLPKFLTLSLIIVIIVSLGVSIVLSNRPGPTSVTSAILLWAVMTSALLAGAKGMKLFALPGVLFKALLLGTISALWLYTVFKGLSEKTLKAAGIIFGVLGIAAVVVSVTGAVSSNLFLTVVFLLNLVFSLSVLKGWGGRIIWGIYGVYSNATGVLGIILSYVRLMALGMTTAGIAMAFNQIAWMFKGIPVVSIILMLAVLVIGHVFNLAMNALGGFVHSLRLQYVEYFPRFFTGGGERFEPFELKTRYVNVTRRN